MTRAASLLSLTVVVFVCSVACSAPPALIDRDAAPPDGTRLDGASPPDGGPAPGWADAGPPDAAPDDAGGPRGDAGPACAHRAPALPTDPTDGEWAARFGNPGVGGELPGVTAIAVAADGTVYVGGRFTTAGYLPVRNVAAWTEASGWRAVGEGLSGTVRSLVVDDGGVIWAAYGPDGGWDATRIARYDGSAWSTVADSTGPIEDLEIIGDDLYAVGSFTAIAGQDLHGAARFDGTTWSGWAGLAPNGAIHAVSVTATETCFGGAFRRLGVMRARAVACFDGTTWSARSLPLDGFPGVYDLERDPADGSLIAAGDFMLDATGTNGGSIARWVGDHWELIGRGVMTELGPGTTREVRGIAFTATGMLVGGAFRMVDAADPQLALGVARWDGTDWDDLGGLIPEVGIVLETTNVLAMDAAPDGSVYFGGLFTRAGSQRVGSVARWDGTYWSGLRTPTERYDSVSGSVDALARHGACAIYVGGEFEYAGAVRVNNIARFTHEGGYEALNEGLAGGVTDIAVSRDERVVAVGNFTGREDAPDVRNIALWDGARWRALGDGLDDMVWGVAIDERESGMRVYAVGDMAASGDVPIARLGMWDGTEWTDLGRGITDAAGSPFLFDVLVDPATHDVIVGGDFVAIGEGDARVETGNIARWDGTRWHAFGSGLDGTVYAITMWNDALVAVGSFTTSGGTDVSRVARWTGTAWEAVGTGGPVGSHVGALEPVGDALYVGGGFDLGGAPANVGVYSGGAWHALGAGTSDVVEALVAADEGVYAGGLFGRAGPVPAVGIALWQYAE